MSSATSVLKELSRFILVALFFFPLHMPAWDALVKAEIV